MSDFKPGDKVQWTNVGAHGRRISMSLSEGEVISCDFGIATVRRKNGKKIQIRAHHLTLKGQRSQIDDVVEAIRSAGKGGAR